MMTFYEARLLRLRLAMTDCGDCFVADAPRNDAFYVIPSDSMSFFFVIPRGSMPRGISHPYNTTFSVTASDSILFLSFRGARRPENLSSLQFQPFSHCEGLNVPKQSLTSCDNERMRLLAFGSQ